MESIYIFFGILSLFVLFIFGNLLLILMVKSQTKRAFKEVDDYLKRKIEMATRIISGISKFASREKNFLKDILNKDLIDQIVKFIKKLLKNKPFSVIYDLSKKEGKTGKQKNKKVKKRIIRNKKK